MKIWISKGQYGYYTTVKGKDKEKKEIKDYFDITFYNCKETTGQIKVNDSFLSVYPTQKGNKFKLVVKEYELLQEQQDFAKPKEDKEDPFSQFGEMVSLESNDFLD